tara:strand:+ start:453 stop:1367 length:915 start_codon:yes stop_codon:yes gene_type:complete
MDVAQEYKFNIKKFVNMKKISKVSKLLFCIFLFESFLITKSSNAFFPIINEPSKQELKSTSIEIGKTAIQLIKLGQNEEAIKLLELAVKLNPSEKDLWISLADAQIRSDKKHQALTSLREAIKLKPKDPSIYFLQGSIYMELNDPRKAKLSLQKSLSLNKNNERGFFQLGNAEILLENYNLALTAFKESSRINSNFWQSINNEGLVLYELNKPKEAISKFELALKISNNAEPKLALAIVLYSSKKNSNESFNLAKNALKSNPQYVSKVYQEKQLWGKRLQKSAQLLFKEKEMKKVVREAMEKSR